MNKINIVTDKSFLFSTGIEKSLDFQKKYKFLLCEDLLYESVKDQAEKRTKIFSKLGQPYVDYEFIPIIPELIRFEITHNEPCKKPSLHIKKRSYSTNEILSSKTHEITDEQKSSIQQLEKTYANLLFFIKKGLEHEFKISTQSDATKHLKELLDGKINDDSYVNSIIHEHRKNGANLPRVNFFTTQSVCYRYFQVYELWITDLRSRYYKFEDIFSSNKATLKLKHDFHDMNYLILALLEGGFATNEQTLIEWFSIINNDGQLITSNS